MRDYLLSTGLYYDNEYLTKYVALCANPQNKENSLYEKHHIISRATSKILGEPENNAESNLVSLDVQNHCLAHYYLALCSKHGQLKYGNMLCLQLFTYRDFGEITEEWILENLVLLDEIRKEQRKLNSALQIGLQSGEKNGNNKYSYEQCAAVKELLLQGFDTETIQDKTGVPARIIQSIYLGKHWSCREDGFFLPSKKRAFKDKTAQEKTRKVDRGPTVKERLEAERIEWQKEIHYCKNCGEAIHEFLKSKNGNGCFCSKHCSVSWSCKEKFKNDPELIKKIVANRDYNGENNPNFGKKASKETRDKISEALRNSEGVKNSPRFSGRKHTEESKAKTSQTLKETFANKRES
jgi:hypothetical protein